MNTGVYKTYEQNKKVMYGNGSKLDQEFFCKSRTLELWERALFDEGLRIN